MKVLVVLSTLLFLIHVSSSSSGTIEKYADQAAKYCGICIQFADQFLNQLLNIVLNIGVVGGCEELCALLMNKTGGGNLPDEVCNVLCDIVGIKEFIAIIEEADLDPIYYCELLKECEIKDDGDASILSLSVNPSTVQQGSSFEIAMSFKTANGTGTGEIGMDIKTMDGIPLGESELLKPQAPGTYNVKWQAKASPDADCDPTQGPCEMWLPGNYSIDVAVCNGQCGSTHPHSKVYDMKSADFKVVN